jgi:metal-sulfur cluster biosynthetic enzyme
MDEELKGRIIGALKKVNDPETNMNVYDMDLITDLKVENGNIHLEFTPSSNVCPLAVQLAFNIRRAVESVEGVVDVEITVTNYVAAARLNELLKK